MPWNLTKRMTCYRCRFFRENLIWGEFSSLHKMTAAEVAGTILSFHQTDAVVFEELGISTELDFL